MPKCWSVGTCQYLQNTTDAVDLLKKFPLMQDTSDADSCSGGKSVHIPTHKSAAALCSWLFNKAVSSAQCTAQNVTYDDEQWSVNDVQGQMADSSEPPFRHLPGDTEEILEWVKTQCLRVNIWSQGTCIRSSSATRSTSTNTAEANCSVRSCAGLVPGYSRIHNLTEWLKHFIWWHHYFCWFSQLSGRRRSDPFQHTYHTTRI